MSLRFLSGGVQTAAALALASCLLGVTPASRVRAAEGTLHACADPDSLPFSNEAGQGFENRIGALLAEWSGDQVEFVWQRMGRGFVREFVNSGRCDVVLGVATKFPALLTTNPYYRSTYVFVAKKDAGFMPASLDDPGLKNVRIAIAALDEEYIPPAKALGRRGLDAQLLGIYSVGAHALDPVNALRDGTAEVAVVWGPVGGYAAKQAPGVYTVAAVVPESDGTLPFTFEISMGVRKGNQELANRLNQFISERHAEIRRVLDDYGVPQLPIASDGNSDAHSVREAR